MSILMIQIFRSVIGFLLLTTEHQGLHHFDIQPQWSNLPIERIGTFFYKARSKLKSYNTSDIGLGCNGESKIYIQESLTEEKRNLFKSCLKFRKDQKYKFIWTYYGVIYLRRNEHTPASRITSVRDLEKLQPRQSTSESTSTTTTEVFSQPS